MTRLVFRLACGSGRTALTRQALVVLGIAFGSGLLLVATGIAGLGRSDFAIPDQAACDDHGTCRVGEVVPGSHGPITLDYLVQPGLRVGVVLGFVLCVVPLLVFVATASRVASRRRDQRLAALRLAGASQHQVRALAMLDAGAAGVLGAVLGTALYLGARAVAMGVDDGQVAAIARGTAPGFGAGVGVLVLLIAALLAGSMLTLRAVQVGPLTVRREAPERRPRPWGLLLLLPLVPLPVIERIRDPFEDTRYPYELVVCPVLAMLGLAASAAWVTATAGRVAGARSTAPSIVLAGRRLEHDPRSQGRALTAVVLVVFAATIGLTALADSLPWSNIGGDDDFMRFGYGAVGVGMGVSLIVGVAGLLLTTTESALERRRTLAALHATGVPLATLRRMLLAQVALPVVPGATLAVAAGLLFAGSMYSVGTVLSGVALFALALPLAATLAAVAATSTTLPLLRSSVDVERLRTP